MDTKDGGGGKFLLILLFSLRSKKTRFEISKKLLSGHNCLTAEMASDGVGHNQRCFRLNRCTFFFRTPAFQTRGLLNYGT